MQQSRVPVAIIGYGAQAKAWALNLRDSQRPFTILLRPESNSLQSAIDAGFEVTILGKESLKDVNHFLLLIPDAEHAVFLNQYKKVIPPNASIVYAHGYSCTKNQFPENFPQWNHLLLAPKAIASEVRFQYETDGKLGALYCLGTNSSEEHKNFLFSLAKDIGITAGPFPSTFQEEAFADLFSEQGLLCSLIPYGALMCYNKLREKGVSQEAAYMECWLEVKLIVDAMVKMGPKAFFSLISPNALIGGEKARKVLFDKEYRLKLDTLLNDIWEKRFFSEVDKCNLEELKQSVNNFWHNQELTHVHNRLGKQLVP